MFVYAKNNEYKYNNKRTENILNNHLHVKSIKKDTGGEHKRSWKSWHENIGRDSYGYFVLKNDAVSQDLLYVRHVFHFSHATLSAVKSSVKCF